MQTLRDVAACAAGYALGSLPVGLWLGRARRGLDVREHGSGSTGATNVLRIVGPGAAVATFGLDVAKGATAVAVARALGAGEAGQVGAGIAAVVGHSWPALARFRGGKSVATGFGGLIMLAPGATPWAVAAGVGVLGITRTVSLGSLSALAAATGAAAASSLRSGQAGPVAYAATASAIIAARHSGNIARLARGTEPRVNLRGKRGAAPAGTPAQPAGRDAERV